MVKTLPVRFFKYGLATELLRETCKGGLILSILAVYVPGNLKIITRALFVFYHFMLSKTDVKQSNRIWLQPYGCVSTHKLSQNPVIIRFGDHLTQKSADGNL